MRNASRIKFAAVVTTLSIGGLTALGIAMGRNDSATVTAESQTVPKARVIHRRKVRTVPAHKPPKPSSSPPSATAAAAPAAPAAVPAATTPVSQPAAVSAPQPVSTKVSPGGGSGGDEHEADDAGHEENGD